MILYFCVGNTDVSNQSYHLDLDIISISFNHDMTQFMPNHTNIIPNNINLLLETHGEKFSYPLTRINHSPSSPNHYPITYQFQHIISNRKINDLYQYNDDNQYQEQYNQSNADNYDERVSITFYGPRLNDVYGFILKNNQQYDIGTISTFAIQENIFITPNHNQDDIIANNAIFQSMGIYQQYPDNTMEYSLYSPILDNDDIFNPNSQNNHHQQSEQFNTQSNNDERTSMNIDDNNTIDVIHNIINGKKYFSNLLFGTNYIHNEHRMDDNNDINENIFQSQQFNNFRQQSISLSSFQTLSTSSITPHTLAVNKKEFNPQHITPFLEQMKQNGFQQQSTDSDSQSTTSTISTTSNNNDNTTPFTTQSSASILFPYSISPTLQKWPNCISTTLPPYQYPIHTTIHQNLANKLAELGITAANTHSEAWSYVSTISNSFLDLYNPITRHQIHAHFYVYSHSTTLYTQQERNAATVNNFFDPYINIPRTPARPYAVMQVGLIAGVIGFDTGSYRMLIMSIDISRFSKFLHRCVYLGLAARGGQSLGSSDATSYSVAYGLMSHIQPLPASTSPDFTNDEKAHQPGDIGYNFDYYSTPVCTAISGLRSGTYQFTTPPITPWTTTTPTCGNGIVEENEECDTLVIDNCTSQCKYAIDTDCSGENTCCQNGLLQPLQTSCGINGVGYCLSTLEGLCYYPTCYTMNDANKIYYNPFATLETEILTNFHTYTNVTQLQQMACTYTCTSESQTTSDTEFPAPLGSKCIYYMPSVYEDEAKTIPKKFYGLCTRPIYNQNDPNNGLLSSSSSVVLCLGGYTEETPHNEFFTPSKPETIKYSWVPLSDQYPQCGRDLVPIMEWKCLRQDNNEKVDNSFCALLTVPPTTSFTCTLLCGANNNKECINNNGVCKVASGGGTTAITCTQTQSGPFNFINPKCYINNQLVPNSRCTDALLQLNENECTDLNTCPFTLYYTTQDNTITNVKQNEIQNKICNVKSFCGQEDIELIPTCQIGADIVNCNDPAVYGPNNNNVPFQTIFQCENYLNCQWDIKCIDLTNIETTTYLPCTDSKTQNCAQLGTCHIETIIEDRQSVCIGTNPNDITKSYIYTNQLPTLPTSCNVPISYAWYTCPLSNINCTYEIQCKNINGGYNDCSTLSTQCPTCGPNDIIIQRNEQNDNIIACVNQELGLTEIMVTYNDITTTQCTTQQSTIIEELFLYTCQIDIDMPLCQYTLECLDIINNTNPPSNNYEENVYIPCDELEPTDVINYYCPIPSTDPIDENIDPMSLCGSREELLMKCFSNDDDGQTFIDFTSIQQYCSSYSEFFYIRCPSAYIGCPCEDIIDGFNTTLNSGINCSILPTINNFTIQLPTLQPILTPSTYNYSGIQKPIVYSEQFITVTWSYTGRPTNNIQFYLLSLPSNKLTQLYSVRSPSILTPIVDINAMKLTSKIFLPSKQGLSQILMVIDGILTQQHINNILEDEANQYVLKSDIFYLQNRCFSSSCQNRITCDTTYNTCSIDQCYSLGCRNFHLPADIMTIPSFMLNAEIINNDNSPIQTNSTITTKKPCHIDPISNNLVQCTCVEPYIGRFCTSIPSCDNTICLNDGYIPYTHSSCSSDQPCVCRNHWGNDDCSECGLDDDCGMNSIADSHCSSCECEFGYTRSFLSSSIKTYTKTIPKVENTDCNCIQSYTLLSFTSTPKFIYSNPTQRSEWFNNIMNQIGIIMNKTEHNIQFKIYDFYTKMQLNTARQELRTLINGTQSDGDNDTDTEIEPLLELPTTIIKPTWYEYDTSQLYIVLGINYCPNHDDSDTSNTELVTKDMIMQFISKLNSIALDKFIAPDGLGIDDGDLSTIPIDDESNPDTNDDDNGPTNNDDDDTIATQQIKLKRSIFTQMDLAEGANDGAFSIGGGLIYITPIHVVNCDEQIDDDAGSSEGSDTGESTYHIQSKKSIKKQLKQKRSILSQLQTEDDGENAATLQPLSCPTTNGPNPTFSSIVLSNIVITKPTTEEDKKQRTNTAVIIICSIVFGTFILAVFFFALSKIPCHKCCKNDEDAMRERKLKEQQKKQQEKIVVQQKKSSNQVQQKR